MFLICMLRSGVRTVLIIDHRKALAVACNTCISILNVQSVWRIHEACLYVMPFPTHLLALLLISTPAVRSQGTRPPSPVMGATLLLQVIVERSQALRL